MPDSSPHIPSSVLITLIQLGSAVSENKAYEIPEDLRDEDALNRHHWKIWDAVTENLSEEDHTSLAKGLVIAENHFGWCGGSVAAGIWIYSSFARRFPASADELANWMLKHSNNPYIPFGSDRGTCRSLDEYHEMRRLDSIRRDDSKRSAELANDKARAAEAVRHRLGEYRQAISQAESAARQAILNELSSLPPEDRIAHIALDDTNPLEFYPPGLLDPPPSLSEPFVNWAFDVVCEKASTRHSGPWRRWLQTVSSDNPKS